MIEDYFTTPLSLSQKAFQYKNDNDGGNNYSGLLSAIMGRFTVDLLLPHRLSRPEAITSERLSLLGMITL